jgi:hypothetical protein
MDSLNSSPTLDGRSAGDNAMEDLMLATRSLVQGSRDAAVDGVKGEPRECEGPEDRDALQFPPGFRSARRRSSVVNSLMRRGSVGGATEEDAVAEDDTLLDNIFADMNNSRQHVVAVLSTVFRHDEIDESFLESPEQSGDFAHAGISPSAAVAAAAAAASAAAATAAAADHAASTGVSHSFNSAQRDTVCFSSASDTHLRPQAGRRSDSVSGPDGSAAAGAGTRRGSVPAATAAELAFLHEEVAKLRLERRERERRESRLANALEEAQSQARELQAHVEHLRVRLRAQRERAARAEEDAAAARRERLAGLTKPQSEIAELRRQVARLSEERTLLQERLTESKLGAKRVAGEADAVRREMIQLKRELGLPTGALARGAAAAGAAAAGLAGRSGAGAPAPPVLLQQLATLRRENHRLVREVCVFSSSLSRHVREERSAADTVRDEADQLAATMHAGAAQLAAVIAEAEADMGLPSGSIAPAAPSSTSTSAPAAVAAAHGPAAAGVGAVAGTAPTPSSSSFSSGNFAAAAPAAAAVVPLGGLGGAPALSSRASLRASGSGVFTFGAGAAAPAAAAASPALGSTSLLARRDPAAPLSTPVFGGISGGLGGLSVGLSGLGSGFGAGGGLGTPTALGSPALGSLGGFNTKRFAAAGGSAPGPGAVGLLGSTLGGAGAGGEVELLSTPLLSAAPGFAPGAGAGAGAGAGEALSALSLTASAVSSSGGGGVGVGVSAADQARQSLPTLSVATPVLAPSVGPAPSPDPGSAGSLTAPSAGARPDSAISAAAAAASSAAAAAASLDALVTPLKPLRRPPLPGSGAAAAGSGAVASGGAGAAPLTNVQRRQLLRDVNLRHFLACAVSAKAECVAWLLKSGDPLLAPGTAAGAPASLCDALTLPATEELYREAMHQRVPFTNYALWLRQQLAAAVALARVDRANAADKDAAHVHGDETGLGARGNSGMSVA